jgi:DNA-binding transcriptional LysR family regulator
MEALLSYQVDLALVANPRHDRRLHQETIIEEKVSLVSGPSHAFFGRSSVRPSELQGLPYLYLCPESPTGRLIREHLARLGVSVEPVGSTDNVETAKKMVEVGLGMAFLPDMVTQTEVEGNSTDSDSKRLVRIDVGPPLVRRIALVTWRHLEISRAVAAFIEELRLYAESAKTSGGQSVENLSDLQSPATA